MPETDVSGESELTEEVRALLRTRVDTYEKLEILQLLHANPQQDWSRTELSERLHMHLPLVESAIEEMHSSGLVCGSVADSGRRGTYSLADDRVKGVTEGLLREYRERPMQILQLIGTYAIERVRTAALRAFADAFVLKKDTDGG